MASGYKLRRTDMGWHQWEMACITDQEVELFSKRRELIDTLTEERGSTPEEEGAVAQVDVQGARYPEQLQKMVGRIRVVF